MLMIKRFGIKLLEMVYPFKVLNNLDVKALFRLIDDKLPLIIKANRATDILKLLEMKKKYNLNLIIMGAQEASLVAKQISISNKLSTSINLEAFEPMVLAAKSAGIKRFVYASSSSVYGISEEKNVTEEHPLVPLTLYNKYKGICEPLLFKHTDKNFEGVIFRPATVCGFAPRQRLDLSVNILTNFAVNKGMIKVFGGDQLRPNLHVMDYCDAVEVLIKSDSEKN